MRIHVIDLVRNVLGVEQIKDRLRTHLLGRSMDMADRRGSHQIQAIRFGLGWRRREPTV